MNGGDLAHRGSARRTLATIAAFFLLWLVLDRTAYLLGSFRGEFGIIVCLAVLAAAVACEMALSGGGFGRSIAAIGLRAPSGKALAAAAALCVLMLCYYPLFAGVAGAEITVRADTVLLAAGVFAQGGIAEEAVFRGFLFRRLREERSFWQAATLASLPFTAVHALLFLSLDFPVALASILLALSISFPLAWLFERSGGSIWPPAIVHAVVQGSIKFVEAGDSFTTLAIGWIAVCAIAPWAFFLLSDRRSGDDEGNVGR